MTPHHRLSAPVRNRFTAMWENVIARRFGRVEAGPQAQRRVIINAWYRDVVARKFARRLVNQLSEQLAAALQFDAGNLRINGCGVVQDGLKLFLYFPGHHYLFAAVASDEPWLQLLDEVDHRPFVIREHINRRADKRGVVRIERYAKSLLTGHYSGSSRVLTTLL